MRKKKKSFGWKPYLWAVTGIFAVIGVGFVVLILTAPERPRNPYCRDLTGEQCESVRDSFNLARNLYVQGKYSLCLTEIAKLKEIVPVYENSQELMTFCEQGRELVNRQRDLEMREKIRAAERAPATAGSYACRRIVSETAIAAHLDKVCNRAKPFSVTKVAEGNGEFLVCCIAK